MPATVNKATQRDDAAIEKQLFHLKAKRFSRFGPPEEAQNALATLTKGWQYHQPRPYVGSSSFWMVFTASG
jgi:hypothetical protein